MSPLGLVFVSLCLASPTPPATGAKSAAASKSTSAEKIAHLQRYIEDDEKKLARIKQELEDPNSEFRRAESEFMEVDGQLAKMEQQRKANKQKEPDAKEKELRHKRQHSRDRFDLAIEQRKTLQEQAKTLPEKIAGERKALEILTGAALPPAPETRRETEAPAKSDGVKQTTTDKSTSPSDKAPAVKTESAVKESKRLKEAREAARLKEEEAQQARDRAKAVGSYLDGIKRQAALEQRLLETARKKATLARHAQAEREADQKKRVDAKAPAGEIENGWKQIQEAVSRVEVATAEEHESGDRLAELHAQLTRAQARLIQVDEEAKKGEKQLQSAKSEVESLENPLHPRNILHWLLTHAGKMLAIISGMFLLHMLVKTSSRRIVRVVAAGALRTGREGEDRAVTLVGVFRTTMSAFIFGGGTLMLLDETGIPVVPLMGGAAVFGLAVAFGAQNLIKDYFTGFMVLMEDQYAVNDIVKINNVGGKVERITLRMTVLRDSGGVAHFIPHGSITSVSNMSHGWSRANLEILIAYKEDVDRVLEVLRDLGDEIRRDDKFGPLTLEDAEVLGVDSLGDSGVVVKMLLKTQATKQWDVKRELLRRVKNRFDQLGIEMPYPHRTIYHHHEGESGARLAA